MIETELKPVSLQVTPGELLRPAREAKGLTESDVASKLCLSVKEIKNIDKDDYTHISARTYARGYLLLYARLVGVADADILQAFEIVADSVGTAETHLPIASHQGIPIYQPRSEGHRSSFLFWVSFLILITLVALVMMWWQGQKIHQVGVTSTSTPAATATAVSIPSTSSNSPPTPTTTQIKPLSDQNVSTSSQSIPPPTPTTNTPLSMGSESSVNYQSRTVSAAPRVISDSSVAPKPSVSQAHNRTSKEASLPAPKQTITRPLTTE